MWDEVLKSIDLINEREDKEQAQTEIVEMIKNISQYDLSNLPEYYNGKYYTESPIHLVSHAGHVHIIEAILNYNSQLLYATDSQGITPLMTSIAGGDKSLPALEILLKKYDHFVIEKKERVDGYSPLEYAMDFNNLKAVALLLVYNLNASDICMSSLESIFKAWQYQGENEDDINISLVDWLRKKGEEKSDIVKLLEDATTISKIMAADSNNNFFINKTNITNLYLLEKVLNYWLKEHVPRIENSKIILSKNFKYITTLQYLLDAIEPNSEQQKVQLDHIKQNFVQEAYNIVSFVNNDSTPTLKYLAASAMLKMPLKVEKQQYFGEKNNQEEKYLVGSSTLISLISSLPQDLVNFTERVAKSQGSTINFTNDHNINIEANNIIEATDITINGKEMPVNNDLI